MKNHLKLKVAWTRVCCCFSGGNGLEIDKFITFCKASLDWCGQESEKSTNMIMDVLGNLSSEVGRIGAMSEESRAALENLKSELKSGEDKEAEAGGENRLYSLSKSIAQINDQFSELGDAVNPIIRALQQQDRISQNMQNIERMMNKWFEVKDQNLSMIEFGNLLMDCTTMDSERDILHKHIEGLPKKEVGSGSALF